MQWSHYSKLFNPWLQLFYISVRVTVSHPDSWVHRNQERRCRSGRRWNQVYRRRSEFVDPACRSYPPSRLRCTHSLQTENINVCCPRCFLTIQVIYLPFPADNGRSERQKTGSKLLSTIMRIVSITNRTPPPWTKHKQASNTVFSLSHSSEILFTQHWFSQNSLKHLTYSRNISGGTGERRTWEHTDTVRRFPD